MVFPPLTPDPTLSLSLRAVVVPRSQPDFLFLHVGFSLTEKSSPYLSTYSPPLCLTVSLSSSPCISSTRSRGLPTTLRIGTFSPSFGFFDLSSRSISVLSHRSSHSVSLALPLLIPTAAHIDLSRTNVLRDSLLVLIVVKVAPCRCSCRRGRGNQAAGSLFKRRSVHERRSRLHIFTPALLTT